MLEYPAHGYNTFNYREDTIPITAVSAEPISLEAIPPIPPTITFSNDAGAVGRLYWQDGRLHFDGDVADSAKIFADWLGDAFAGYVALQKHEAVEQYIARQWEEVQERGYAVIVPKQKC